MKHPSFKACGHNTLYTHTHPYVTGTTEEERTKSTGNIRPNLLKNCITFVSVFHQFS